MTLIGVDGCPGGWAAAIRLARDSPIELRFIASLEELLPLLTRRSVMAVDMPIGLPATGFRRCDKEARGALGVRRSTLFMAPPRCVLEASSHQEASDLAAASTDKRISIQAWNLVPKILELQQFLDRHAPLKQRCYETHPELCFARLNGGEAIKSPKSTADGREIRRQLLGKFFGKTAVSQSLSKASAVRTPMVDRLDACACLAVATHITDGNQRVLPGNPERGEATIVF